MTSSDSYNPYDPNLLGDMLNASSPMQQAINSVNQDTSDGSRCSHVDNRALSETETWAPSYKKVSFNWIGHAYRSVKSRLGLGLGDVSYWYSYTGRQNPSLGGDIAVWLDSRVASITVSTFRANELKISSFYSNPLPNNPARAVKKLISVYEKYAELVGAGVIETKLSPGDESLVPYYIQGGFSITVETLGGVRLRKVL